MKTRTYIKSEAKSDMGRIIEAHMILREHIKNKPADKVKVEVPLNNGRFLILTLTPRF